MINRIVLVGRITKNPELKSTQSNISFMNFTLAVNRQFKNADGETEADFISCVAWRKTAELISQYVRKGNLLAIDGKLQTRSYQADDGTMRYVTEVVADSVVFLEPKKEDKSAEKKAGYQEDPQYEPYEPEPTIYDETDIFPPNETDDNPDNLPF